jgi:exocyst complex component 2
MIVIQSIRLLLTLSDLTDLRAEIVPQLISLFETNFSVKLTDESKTIRDVLQQIDARLFQIYTKPIADRLANTIQAGLTSPEWAPASPRESRNPSPFTSSVLLDMVIVHTEVSTTAAPLMPDILKYLLEQILNALIATFKQRPKYSLTDLMQATLDVEFISQTLSSYTTEKATVIQADIYQVLDTRTDNQARVNLQNELPSLRLILKRLKESTKAEFACFRRPKRGTIGERPGE